MFNGIVFAVGLAETSGIALPEDFASDLNGAALMVIGVGGVMLRAVTKSAVGWKQ